MGWVFQISYGPDFLFDYFRSFFVRTDGLQDVYVVMLPYCAGAQPSYHRGQFELIFGPDFLFVFGSLFILTVGLQDTNVVVLYCAGAQPSNHRGHVELIGPDFPLTLLGPFSFILTVGLLFLTVGIF